MAPRHVGCRRDVLDFLVCLEALRNIIRRNSPLSTYERTVLIEWTRDLWDELMLSGPVEPRGSHDRQTGVKPRGSSHDGPRRS